MPSIPWPLNLSLYMIRLGVKKSTEKTTRNSSGDEIANVNFLYDDIVHALQNTIDSCMDSTTDRRGYVGTQVYQILEIQ